MVPSTASIFLLIAAMASGLAGVGAYSAWAELKPRKISLHLGLLVALGSVMAVGSAAILGAVAGRMLAQSAPHVGGWVSAITGMALIVACGVGAVWLAVILQQVAQNAARRLVGLPSKHIEWIRRYAPRRAKRHKR